MEITAKMQENYQTKRDQIFEFIYSTERGIGLSRELPDNPQRNNYYNEFFFMPYIQENGNVGEDLREEYLGSLIKSMIQNHIGMANDWSFSSKREGLKYGLEGSGFNWSYNFGRFNRRSINEVFADIIRGLPGFISSGGGRQAQKWFLSNGSRCK